jgi:hypothetical protein
MLRGDDNDNIMVMSKEIAEDSGRRRIVTA